MFIKKKHIQVVFFSSIIIVIVFATTLVGYSLYIQWKADSLLSRYQHSIYKLTAEIFQKDIIISNVKVSLENGEASRGVPLIEGNLKNNTNKTVTSILIKVSFLTPDGSVLYNDWFYPLGGQYFAQAPLFSGLNETRNLVVSGGTITFRRRLRNCPPSLISKLSKSGGNLTDAHSKKEGIELVYSVTGLGVL